MMSRSHNGDLNFDEENEDYDTMENAMENYEYDTRSKTTSTI